MAAQPSGMPTAKAGGAKFALPRVPLWLVYALGFVPAVWYFYLGVTDQLGADPM